MTSVPPDALLDVDRLFDQLVYAMDHTPWVARRQEAGITVSSGHPSFEPQGAPHAAEGFLIAAECSGVTLDHALAYFHDACHFADTANAMTTRSQIVSVEEGRLDHYRAVVRTGFALPWPLRDREFLHDVATRRDRDERGRQRVLIAYATASEEGVPPAWPGYLRCAMAPSGQRATLLEDGRVRVEHCMTYPLGGAISAWMQTHVFHRGHVTAYFDEWRAAMATLGDEAKAGPARTEGRVPGETAARP